MKQILNQRQYEPVAGGDLPLPEDQEFRCVHCGADKFAVLKDGVMHIKYKDRVAQIANASSGMSVSFTCRNCNQITVVQWNDIVDVNELPDLDPPPSGPPKSKPPKRKKG